ncbi:MAG: adenine nucleotide alpha hydrolase [Rhodobiaceae bacterium]|nr:adenine nucleotide alpha hydrolase [Rhodobiaceae bacterium]
MSALASLRRVLAGYDTLAVAVSGGIDSMVLAHVAHEVLGSRARMAHAISPAVPAAATARVKRHAARGGWRLDLVDAGEFGDPRYRENPVDRCYFCKLNLYGTVAALTGGTVASGTNVDDLGDFRPGLKAAAEWNVVHPYVDAGLGKEDIYALARDLGLDDLAELPAQPCLASRVETGIAVEAEDLAFIETVEAALARRLGVGAVLRCRITHQGVILELAPDVSGPAQADAIADAADLSAATGRTFLGTRTYRRGAAFLQEAVR